MNDCSYILFDLCRNHHPYKPSEPTDRRTSQRLADAKTHLEALPPEYQHHLFEIIDSMNILDYEHSHHAFLLGLDLGLSIAETMLPFKESPDFTPPP